ncbi:AraC family transcriptional regulator [Paracoccus xiamenensis]|uniref:AraC family transcriptional regulator n=1 Tax=Paracoccus xiamenensis TaxID=2714901 RepID=UPI00140765E9|nr:AraC family transcriptional regulator [Paracoccus xiamenensis]NHF72573.1 AraC family transcriptional regulator [Paracoccus xiamenensis]
MLDRNPRDVPPRDAVSELLMGMRLQGARYWRLRLSPPFGIQFDEFSGARFHFVGQGQAYLLLPNLEPRLMQAGDAVLVPRGHPHKVLSAPRVPSRSFESFTPEPVCEVFCEIRDCDPSVCRTTDCTILTGTMELDMATMHPLVSFMPEVMSVGALLSRQPEMRTILAAMEREMSEDRAGSVGVLARLADVIAALIVRGWIECGCDNTTGVIAALQDPGLARVLVAIHSDPSRDWDVPSMAALLGASRSAFSERFTKTVGLSPLRYLTELRMGIAAKRLESEHIPVAQLAHQLGYGSQAAFNRAFKRVIGVPPASYRKTNSPFSSKSA